MIIPHFWKMVRPFLQKKRFPSFLYELRERLSIQMLVSYPHTLRNVIRSIHGKVAVVNHLPHIPIGNFTVFLKVTGINGDHNDRGPQHLHEPSLYIQRTKGTKVCY